MDAREYLNRLKDDDLLIQLAHFGTRDCDGHGMALIIDEEENIAVMLGDCGDPETTLVKAGALVKFVRHPEAEPTIVGTVAYAVPVILRGTRR